MATCVAASGLAGLVIGALIVNLVPTPRAAQLGTILAGAGIILLVAIAVRQVLF